MDVIGELSAGARDLLEMLCVAFDPMAEQAIGPVAAPGAIDELEARGLLQRVWPDQAWRQREGPGLHCHKVVREPVVRRVAEEGRLPELKRRLDAFPNLRHCMGYRLHLALYANLDTAVFEQTTQSVDSRQWEPVLYSIVMRPFEPTLWDRVPAAWQPAAAASILGWCLHRPDDPRPLLGRLDTRDWTAAGRYAVHAVEAEILALSGRPEEASVQIARLPALPRSAVDRWGYGAEEPPEPEALQALVEFVRGRADEAVRLFAVALKSWRRRSRSRKAALPGDLGMFHVLALYRTGDVAFGRQLAEQGPYQGPREHDRLKQMATLLEGHRLPPPQGGRERTYEVLLDGLLHHWNNTLTESQRGDLQQLQARSRAAGLDWIADQAAEILGEPRRLPYPPLTGMVATGQPWERVLSALRGLAPTAPVVDSSATRLVWVLGWENDRVTTVEAREQAPRQGGWTRGRTVALEAVAKTAGATEHDVRVAAAVDRERQRVLVALVGHPRVFWADTPEQAVEVVQMQPQMRVRRTAGGMEVSVHPEAGHVVAQREPGRLCVFVPRPEHAAMAELLKGGLQVPEHARPVVAETLSALASVVEVQSDVASDEVAEVVADSRLRVSLVPRGDGFTMRVRVHPLGTGGPVFVPGVGGAVVMGTVDGMARQTTRDLQAERAAWQHLQEVCGTEETADLMESLQLLAALRGLGDSIEVAWPQGGAVRVARASSASLSLRVRGERDWFAADGTVTLDDGRVLEMRTLLAGMDGARGPFVPLGEDGFVALEQSLWRRLEALRAYGEVHGSAVRIHPLAAPALQEALQDAESDARWQAHLRSLEETSVAALPSTLQAELRDYQMEGFEWLARLAGWHAAACLADDMGLGKTLQTLALILHRGGPTLVVAPTSVCHNWMAEAARFAPTLQLRLYAGAERSLEDLSPDHLVVCSYTVMQLDVERLRAISWRTVVLDEAQAIKNVATQRAKAALTLPAGFRLALTGTPVENHLGELWTLFRFLIPGLLGSSPQFQRRFASPIERHGNAAVRARLRRLVAPFILRRTKSQVLEQLPPRIEITLAVELSEAERALYEAVRQQALEEVSGAGQMQILAAIMKLRRTACNPRLVMPDCGVSSARLEALDGLLEELRENRHRALVFSQFTDHLALVREHLERRGIDYQYLDGTTPMAERQARVEAFQQGQGAVFLISLRAGGTGLNLTAADYVIHLDPWWNPAVEDQASDRAHRIGQERPVTIYRLIARGTIEEQIVQLHRDKRRLAESLLEGTEGVARLTAEELRGLLRS
ncbi:MAG: SNF2-related protein [Candidatus Xenobia bacterium]